MNSKQFMALPYDILKLQDLSLTEKILLSRIAGFGEYYESASKCSELLGVKEDTIAKAKRHLVELKYISETANTGRGKKYVATFSWKKRNQPEVTAKPKEQVSDNAEFDPASIGLTASSSEPQRTKRVKFEKRYCDYMSAYDKGLAYLKKHHIGVANKKGLQSDFAALVDTFSEYQPADVADMLCAYLDYLESDEYLYQLEKTKYCPQVQTQYDLYRKFTAIRNFKNSKDRQYDPRTTLTN